MTSIPDRPSAFQTTTVGSLPHLNGQELSRHLVETIDIPCWPQLPRRDFCENMYVQFSRGLPAIKLDRVQEKIFFDTTADFSDALTTFYGNYLDDNLAAFSLSSDYAAGFFDMLAALKTIPGLWAKGQVTGPISFGLTVSDQDRRAALYNEILADVIVKQLAMNARWQAKQLKAFRSQVLIFVDEPYMASFGSAFISLARNLAITMLDEVFAAIHSEGALAGVHCCANTDWSVLLATTVDILNLDAYGYLENLALYPAELRAFLNRGGLLAWGIVPNNEEIWQVTPAGLAERLRRGLEWIADKAQGRQISLGVDELAERSLVTPSCGLGPATVELAEQALHHLVRVGEILQRG